MNYNVSDFVIRLKNAAAAGRRKVVLPYSKIGKTIGKILVAQRFLEDLKEEVLKGKKVLAAKIYFKKRKPAINGVLVVSKPSLRVYLKAKSLKSQKKQGYEVVILSTNQGVMTEEAARKKEIGGEILFKIW